MNRSNTFFSEMYEAILRGTVPSCYDGMALDLQLRLGNELRVFRKRAGHTQAHIAETLYCSPSTISAIENGAVFANFELFYRLCELYNLVFGLLVFRAQMTCLLEHFNDKWTYFHYHFH